MPRLLHGRRNAFDGMIEFIALAENFIGDVPLNRIQTNPRLDEEHIEPMAPDVIPQNLEAERLQVLVYHVHRPPRVLPDIPPRSPGAFLAMNLC